MREIKFRAWDKEYEYMYQNAYPFEHLVYVEMHDDDETFEQFKHKMQKVNGKWFYFIIAKDMELMQYTGLHDRSGKEIYEGDIVRFFPIEARGVITWADVGFTIVSSEHQRTFVLHPENWEVIGNIYENPELVNPKP
jgi:uncharacterized phage protein (TIGR01671 family)